LQAFIQQIISGIASGGIFASLALALVLIYNAMGLVNFAQGEMAMFATFIAFTLIDRGLSYWIALPVTLVIAFAGFKRGHTAWLCRCDCGTEKIISSDPLRRGYSHSCGCLNRELSAERARVLPRARKR